MKQYLHIVFLLLLILPIVYTSGQSPNYPVREFNTQHGLQYDIVKIVKDTKGFIWLMYLDKIQRFDGKNTDTYFENGRIYSLFVDTQGDVWATTRKGIFRFDRQNSRFSAIASKETAPIARVIFEPEKGQLCYISRSGIYVYDKVLNRFITSGLHSHQLNPEVNLSIFAFSYVNHTLYYCTGNILWRHNIQSGKADKKVFWEIKSFREIRRVLALSEQEIIITTWQDTSWYYNFSTKQQIILSTYDEAPLLSVFDAITIDKNHYYLATNKGLLAYKANTDRPCRINLSLNGRPYPVQWYKALHKEKDGRVWASFRSGLVNFNPFEANINFKNNIGEPTDWPNHIVFNFAEDEKGNLWLATRNGLTYWDMEHNRFSTILAEENATDRLNYAHIRGLAYDGNNLIIGQAKKGIWLYDPTTKRFKRPVFKTDEKGRIIKEEINQVLIQQIKTLKNGSHIIAASDNGAYLMNGKNYSIEAIDFPDARPHVEFAYQDTKGTIFIGTKNGLYCFDVSLNYQYKIKEKLEDPWTLSVLEHNSGYYLGTERGVYFFSAHKDILKVEKIIPELKDHSIRTLFEGIHNTIWIVTRNKLHHYFPETGYLKTYSDSENIQGYVFYMNSYVRKRNGQVFIGGINGINYFYPEKIAIRHEQLLPYIREVNVREFKDSIVNHFTKPLHLKQNQNTITINFSTPHYGNPDDIKYRYQLTKDGQWFNHGNQSSLTLWQLPPGAYQFRIAVASPDGIWRTSEETFRFTIPSPFWKKWWFTPVMIILGAVILYGIFIFISSQRKLKTERLLNTFATSLYGHNTVDDILRDIARNCVAQLKFINCVIYEVDKKKQFLVQRAVVGIENPYDREITNEMKIPIGKGIVGAVAASGQSERIKNTERDPRYLVYGEKALSGITVPILVEGEVFGVIDSQHPKTNFYTRYHVRLLEKIANLCADRIRKYLTEEKLRGKIARDLHDEMGSTLTGIHIISKMNEKKLREDTLLRRQLSRISHHASDMIEKMSDMVWVVNPANDDLDKLMYKIREYAVEVLEPKNIEISFREAAAAKYIKINPEQRKNIYLIAKETLNNAAKYSEATTVVVAFKEENGVLEMYIRDNGKGYDPSVSHSGNGIKNIHARAEEIDAAVQIDTTVGKGMSLLLRLAVKRIWPL